MNQERAGELLIKAIKAYWYVFNIFIGALVMTWVGASLASLLPVPKAWTPQDVKNAAWIAGAIVMLIGYPMGFRFTMGKVGERVKEKAVPKPARTIDRSFGYALRTGGGLAFLGAFAGLLLGGTLIAIWLSIAAGPFAPEEWASAVKTKGMGASTQHPIPMIIGFVAVAGLALIGFVLGVIGAPRGWATSEPG